MGCKALLWSTVGVFSKMGVEKLCSKPPTCQRSMARLMLTYEQQFPAGKKGQKRGRVDLTTFESTHGASTQSKDRLKAELFDYPEFAIYFKTKKGYTDAECLQMWHELEIVLNRLMYVDLSTICI